MTIWNNCKHYKSKRWLVITMDFSKDVYCAYHCKTLRQAKNTFDALVDMKYAGEIQVNAIFLKDKKNGRTINED